MSPPTPNPRAPIGVLLLLLLILCYALAMVWLFEPVSRLPALVQLPLWLFLGFAWIFPARPLTVWIATGRWRTRKD